MSDLPEGFKPLFRTSPFIDLVGPVFYRDGVEGGFVLGLRIEEKHCNGRGFAHGGLFMTLADIALGYNTALSVDPPANLTTASLTTDFVGTVRKGDWLEIEVEIERLGNRLAFANAHMNVDGKRVCRASAVFSRSEAAVRSAG
ncbi:PaaI family thioesterase [Oceanibacterium hippocampi]|uniref:Thioesterase superfamily protein n=1 Tax=Oceanibacterium hippocampi TaxID=745714 RepID=A0A1Y5TBV5_9PROT|nr:PaaI family thioesterase [Oceanibacterium hippocampi]SLN60232.1 Thioesterase superfamily protein [Oceanibacterium hippocampi]